MEDYNVYQLHYLSVSYSYLLFLKSKSFTTRSLLFQRIEGGLQKVGRIALYKDYYNLSPIFKIIGE